MKTASEPVERTGNPSDPARQGAAHNESANSESAHDESANADTARGHRGPEEIEQDISRIRSRMDAVMDEIEYRLSPGQLSGGVIDVVRDVVQGKPSRVATAIRSNPWPLAVMAAGALWLAWTVSRTPEPAPDSAPAEPPISNRHMRLMLTGLVVACRQGASGFRQADLILDDPALTPRLAQVAAQFDRGAAALEEELLRHGGTCGPDEPVHPVWRDLHIELGGGRARGAVLSGLEHGIDGTLDLFRDTLREDLPERSRVVVGAHLHELETARHRIGALREAVA